MEPKSLAEYQAEVYNIGSPRPSPKKTPLSVLPKVKNTTKLPQPLKVKLPFTKSTQKRARKDTSNSDSDDLQSPPKKMKLDDETQKHISEIMDAVIKRNQEPVLEEVRSVSRAIGEIRTEVENEKIARQGMQGHGSYFVRFSRVRFEEQQI